jgi:hypothetical protein
MMLSHGVYLIPPLTREYARLCKLGRSFKPSPMLGVETLNENAREIYENACARMLNTRKD